MLVKMVTNRVNGRRDINFIEHLARIRRVLPYQPSTKQNNNCTGGTEVHSASVLEEGLEIPQGSSTVQLLRLQFDALADAKFNSISAGSAYCGRLADHLLQ